MKHLVLTCLVLFLTAVTFAQDPTKVAPNAYKLDFENEWVKVTKVHYAPHAKIPAHDHTETGAAYVYLSDSGPVIFKHIGLSYAGVTRAAVKARSFRLYKAVKEVHEVENPNDTASDFLRIEFKTVEDTKKPLRGKFQPGDLASAENIQQVEFENEQLRATRLVCAKGKVCELSALGAEPQLIVGLTSVQVAPTGKSQRITLASGKTQWLATGEKAQIKGIKGESAEVVIFALKGSPVKTEKGKADAHKHE